jgi:hypothetical protein
VDLVSVLAHQNARNGYGQVKDLYQITAPVEDVNEAALACVILLYRDEFPGKNREQVFLRECARNIKAALSFELERERWSLAREKAVVSEWCRHLTNKVG